MRKTVLIIAIGIFITLFPLLALPPQVEMWMLLFVGIGIIVFGLYEQIANKEKIEKSIQVDKISEEQQQEQQQQEEEGVGRVDEVLQEEGDEQDEEGSHDTHL